jgi:SAM-dependent methyltransferase
MGLSAAEIQLLASLGRALLKDLPADQNSLEANADRFWIFHENWKGAYDSLPSKGLITGDASGYSLTKTGKPIAIEYHRQRPDMYWYYYQKFYQAAQSSAAHSKLCQRAFGADHCQEGQTDMEAFDFMLDKLGVSSTDQVLDLGCGAGGLAEYIFDKTGAKVHGIDYSKQGIAEASRRTTKKRDRLSFAYGDMNNLELPPHFNVVISVDTLYWAADLKETIQKLKATIRPGGSIGAYMNHHIVSGTDKSMLGVDNTNLSHALSEIGLDFETYNLTENVSKFWQRNLDASLDLQTEFEAEGNGFIAANLIREAEEEYLPDIRNNNMARYLYHVHV